MDIDTNTAIVADTSMGLGLASESSGLQSPYTDLPQKIGNSMRIEAENFDLGGQNVAYNDEQSANYGGVFRTDEGVDIEQTKDRGGGYNLGWLRNKEWVEYTTDITGGTYNLKVRVASAVPNPGSLRVKLDDKLLGVVDVSGTNDWQKWQTLTLKNIKLSGGKDRTLRLEVEDGGDFNLNWLEFAPVANSSPQPTPSTPPTTNKPKQVIAPPGTFKEIAANNQNFHYTGRVEGQNSAAPVLTYAGSSVGFNFSGTGLKVKLAEDNWGGENYVDVYIDDNPNPKTIRLKTGQQPQVYDIATGLENKSHKALIVKRNDYMTGEFEFHGIVTDGKLLPNNLATNRKIEVYGDSISVGAAVEYGKAGTPDPPGNTPDLDNAYKSFGWILAREYDAEVSLVAQGGVPLVDGYGSWNQGTGMEAFYDKTKPFADAPQWNFDRYNPDLVIVALGQNDQGITTISSREWKNRYKRFFQRLRAEHPNAYFVGMFPNMYHDPKWDAYLTEAIAEYKKETNDNKVYSLITKQVTPGHPRYSEQKAIADALSTLIDGTLVDDGFNWNVAN